MTKSNLFYLYIIENILHFFFMSKVNFREVPSGCNFDFLHSRMHKQENGFENLKQLNLGWLYICKCSYTEFYLNQFLLEQMSLDWIIPTHSGSKQINIRKWWSEQPQHKLLTTTKNITAQQVQKFLSLMLNAEILVNNWI